MEQKHGTYHDSGLHIRYIAITDIGKVRNNNDDNFLVNTDCNCFAIADGVGSLVGSNNASLIALDIIKKKYKKPKIPFLFFKKNKIYEKNKNIIGEILQEANTSIYNLKINSGENIATTVVASFFFGNECIVAHVGDSRFYKIHENFIEQVTVDHSLKNEILRKSEHKIAQSDIKILKNIITRALGANKTVLCEFNRVPIYPYNFFMLCSDGLTSMLNADTISSIVCNQQIDLIKKGHTLIESANIAGGKDNITVILVEISKNPLS